MKSKLGAVDIVVKDTVVKLGLALGLILCGLGIVNYFSFYPVQVAADEEEFFGAPFLTETLMGSSESDNSVVLVVDTAGIRLAGKSGKFSETDWSYGWINLLLQEARSFDVIDIGDLGGVVVDGSQRVWVFSRSAVANSSGNEIGEFIGRLAQGGGGVERVVYLEAPDTLCAKNAVVESLLGSEVTPRRFTHLTHLIEPDGYEGPDVSSFGFSCDGLSVINVSAEMKSSLALDSHEVMWESRRSGLRLLVGAFDFGELAVSIQQGKPNDDFSVTPKITKRTGMFPVVSSDLCSDSSYYHSFTPFFDNFERALFAIITGERLGKPLFENSPKGAFIMSHDEEGMGDKAAWMAKQEKRWGVRSSTLATTAAITSVGIAEILEAGGEVALHVDQYSYFKRPGVPGLRPFKVEYSIAEQKQELELRLAKAGALDSEVTINRNHWLLWSDNYTGMFRKLAGAGVRMDLSYGPIGEGVAGYLFGTCFPFVPIDTNGFPLPILELPFLFQDDEEFAAGYLNEIFDTSRFENEIVNVIFHTNTMGHYPDTLLMWGWEESFQRAKEAKLPIVHYRDVVAALKKQKATLPSGILDGN